MSPDRPFVLCGWAPDGQPIKPWRYRDPETAECVARLLRSSGYQVALIPAAPGGRGRGGSERTGPGATQEPGPR